MLLLEALATAAVGAAVALPSGYLAFLAAATLRRPPAPPPETTLGEALRFAILVPAHDEEAGIARTVANLLAVDYPRDRFSVHVVADNCVDATAAAARRAGACVHVRNDLGAQGKGAALNWLAPEVDRELGDPDAFVIVDADSEVSSNFLRCMARYVSSGASVVQALNLVGVSGDSPLIRIRELAFRLSCHLRPLAYQILGASSSLHGNGMCFAAPVLRRYRWSERSVTEDGELFLRLIGEGYRVALAADATVRSVMPAKLGQARSQAIRWERGRFDYASTGLRLVAAGLRRRDITRFIAGLGILVPPIAILAAGAVLALVAGAATGVQSLLVLGAASCLALLFYGWRGAALGGMSPRTLLQIALWVPPYVLWKVWVIALAATGAGRRKWARGTRAAQA
jgi:cellulose synthase/poly-beta-1,6-N-acetylglucosamine synthase-like glycosyltransferase